MKTAIYIGRFQPFTKTHRSVVQFIDAEPDIGEIIIIKGSAQWSDANPDPYSLPSRNPFTAEECSHMIRRSLTRRVRKSWRIIPIPDTETKFSDPLWKEWVSAIVAVIGHKDFVVYTNDPREKDAFMYAGIETKSFPVQPAYQRATDVRRAIAEQKSSQWCVDPEVAEHISQINGGNRIAALFEQEK